MEYLLNKHCKIFSLGVNIIPPLILHHVRKSKAYFRESDLFQEGQEVKFKVTRDSRSASTGKKYHYSILSKSERIKLHTIKQLIVNSIY